MKIIKQSHRFVTLVVASLLLFSCESDDTTDDPVLQIDPPIELSCNYFSNNPNAVLEDNPNAPVDYIVSCKMSIPDDVTIEPGVTIAFQTNTGFAILETGSLKAIGTVNKPITFTGVDKERGAWGGIYFNSNDSKNEFNHTILEYAGGTAVYGGSSEKGGIVYGPGSSLKLTNSLIQHCTGWGINLYYTVNEERTTIESNTFKENAIPLQISSAMIDVVKSNNQFIDNTINKVEVKNTFSIGGGNKTMHKLSVPYSIVNGNGVFSIAEGNLVIQPGTVIEMGAGKYIEIRASGSLKAVGTSSEKIIIRGDVEAPGGWQNIQFHTTSSPNNQFKHVIIKHAGAGANPNSNIHIRGAVYLGYAPTVLIEDTHFEDILSCIIYSDQHGMGNLTIGANVTSTNVNTANLDCP